MPDFVPEILWMDASAKSKLPRSGSDSGKPVLHPPFQGHRRAPGIFLLWGPRGALLSLSEVPLYRFDAGKCWEGHGKDGLGDSGIERDIRCLEIYQMFRGRSDVSRVIRCLASDQMQGSHLLSKVDLQC